MEKISFLNGKFLPHNQCFVHIEDRGFQFADSVYEVILFKNNKLIDVDWHLDRLVRSLHEMKIKFNQNEAQLKNIFLDLFKQNNLKEGSVYLQITRGTAPRMAGFPEEYQPTIIAVVSALKEMKNAISVTIKPDIRWGRCDIKTTALFASSLAKQNAVEMGFDDVIFTRDGFITEASFANVFMVDGENKLITAGLDQNLLGGITRKRFLDLASKNGITTIEKKFTADELTQAREVFVSSSTLLIRPVIKIDNQIIADGEVGEITKKLISLYNKFINQL